jgi:(p)ppGpp synthase/HD superfamily hydrolase
MADPAIPWTQDEYLRALWFAADAHQGQLVPGTQHSYLMHVTLVAMEVIGALRAEPQRDQPLAVTCALLHDVVEDTHVGLDELRAAFGDAVAAGVAALSKDPKLPKERQLADSLDRIRRQPREVWMVKLADRITNLQPPPPHWTPDKIARYREEAVAIRDALAEASPFLAERITRKIEAYGAVETK